MKQFFICMFFFLFCMNLFLENTFAQTCHEKEAIMKTLTQRREFFKEVQSKYSLDPNEIHGNLGRCLASIQLLQKGFSLGAITPDFEKLLNKLCKKLDDKINDQVNNLEKEILPEDVMFGLKNEFKIEIDADAAANELVNEIK